MKRCSGCKRHKDESEFAKNKSKKDGLHNWCKVCLSANKAKWRAEHKERDRAYQAKWRTENKEHRLAYSAKWRAKNPGYRVKWRAEHKEHERAYDAKYKRERKRTDRQFALACGLRERLANALRGNFKSGSAVRDLGMTIPEFEAYVETMFLPEMTWDNWTDDGWHLDHIYPLAKADLTDRVQFLAVANWQNYQPMWAADNIAKGDTVTPEAQALFDRLVAQFRKEEAA
jgi:hypothetical protein